MFDKFIVMSAPFGKLLIALLLLTVSCKGGDSTRQVITGAEQVDEYIPLLRGKSVAVVANQTSMIGNTHLVDSLVSLGIDIRFVYAPEHGFRGNVEAGGSINDDTDRKTGLPLKSLYGASKKPDQKDVKQVDVVVFDIQDVGARFYTYISTLQYIMEACADAAIPVMILDRPNPNGHYVDGPVLDTAFRSFVGMNAIPVVHGLTVAEYANMLNGEQWLEGAKSCSLLTVKCKNWDHTVKYSLPVPPSPNLPTMTAVYLYPSLCFFEGTDVSVGRGTLFPFQVIGKPDFSQGDFSFKPVKIPGKAESPLHEGRTCYGYDLRNGDNIYANKLNLGWLIEFYSHSRKDSFFNSFFDKLAGTALLKQQIVEGLNAEQIAASWKNDLEKFKAKRRKYLLYKDFE